MAYSLCILFLFDCVQEKAVYSVCESFSDEAALCVIVLFFSHPHVAQGRSTFTKFKVFHRSNHMYELKHFGMVWQRHIREKCFGAQRKPYLNS